MNTNINIQLSIPFGETFPHYWKIFILKKHIYMKYGLTCRTQYFQEECVKFTFNMLNIRVAIK
jgi:hypothetical protein